MSMLFNIGLFISQNWNEAIVRYRTVLRAMESSATQTLRLTFARQLAEVLLRKMSSVMFSFIHLIRGCVSLNY